MATTEYAGADALCLLWARVAVKWPWAMQVPGLGARDEWRWSGPKVVWRLARYVRCSFQVSSELGEYLRGGHSTRELDGLDALRVSTFFGESGDLRGRSGVARAVQVQVQVQVRQGSDQSGS